MSLAGKVVIITGAGSGIGRATAFKAASEGAILALGDINPSGLEETFRQCQLSFDVPKALHVQFSFDVGSSSGCSSFVDAIMTVHRKIDCVFNCAGINPTRIPTEAVSDDMLDKMINTNLKGTFNMTRACLPHMRSGSSFVNVSSVAGLHPISEFAIYCATKHAVVGFSKSVALEVGPRGIRVNVVAPGSIDTPTNASVQAGNEALKNTAKAVGLRRVGTAEEVADVVLFLFGDGSRYMNGSVVEIHGGLGVQ
ncbi:NAD(P)-binding protein [Pleurostoma richardsiae]|uniref:NAD(P)-binding protein n=1 Tax=Pleurostoma richardsiae TaxID=41990 RepID=A0AA38RJA0_9PEZI|nr:NAD(P)-binding protein [Pleurostoma richardsiae]